MHDGCSKRFESGKQIADKVRMMGYAQLPMAIPLAIDCMNCKARFGMNTMVAQCPECNMVFAVTPCHCHSAEHVKPAGIDY